MSLHHLALALGLLAGSAIILPDRVFAQDAQHDHSKMDHSKMDHSKMDHAAAGAVTPATTAFEAANARMHKDMAITYSGDADVDFVRGMIPHHIGAVDMAKIVLEHGKDPELRKLAEEIIAAQDKEIAFMRLWLEKKGVQP